MLETRANQSDKEMSWNFLTQVMAFLFILNPQMMMMIEQVSSENRDYRRWKFPHRQPNRGCVCGGGGKQLVRLIARGTRYSIGMVAFATIYLPYGDIEKLFCQFY